jgi:hypothetical protein
MKSPFSSLYLAYCENTAFKVSFLYAVFSILWILLSDQILFWLVKDPELLTSFQILKGGLFVIGTSIIIFLLLRKEISRINDPRSKLSRLGSPLLRKAGY